MEPPDRVAVLGAGPRGLACGKREPPQPGRECCPRMRAFRPIADESTARGTRHGPARQFHVKRSCGGRAADGPGGSLEPLWRCGDRTCPRLDVSAPEYFRVCCSGYDLGSLGVTTRRGKPSIQAWCLDAPPPRRGAGSATRSGIAVEEPGREDRVACLRPVAPGYAAATPERALTAPDGQAAGALVCSGLSPGLYSAGRFAVRPSQAGATAGNL